MKLTAEQKEKLDTAGKTIQYQLDNFFKQWGQPMKFRDAISNKLYYANKAKVSLDEFSQYLEEHNFISIIYSQSGARFVFSSNCGLTPDEMMSIIVEMDELDKQK
jgi:hypothetical protein